MTAPRIRCQACGRLHDAGRRQCRCGEQLPELPTLDRQAVLDRQAAVERALSVEGRLVLATLLDAFAPVGPWWRLDVIREPVVLAAVEHLAAQGVALRSIADRLGMPYSTVREQLERLVRQKAEL